MENVKENNQEMILNEKTGEIDKPYQQPDQQENHNQLQQQNMQDQELQEHKEIQNETTPGEKQQQTEPHIISYEENNDEDEDDDDEKETSQKLVIDIPDEDDEEKDDEEDDDDDILAIEDLPREVTPQQENEKVPIKTPKPDTIITLSDGEEDIQTKELSSKPGKVQKRRSMGAGSGNDEDHFRLKRRKINAAGAPKLPLTGYVRYMNDRRESLRKEHPTKTHMEHNKMIGEEWHALPADVKSSYLKAADVDKQRLF